MLRDKIKVAAAVLAVAFGVGWCRDAMADGLPKSGLLPIGEVAKAGSWSGVYVGAGIGYQIADTNLSLDVDAPSVPFSGSILEIDGLSGRGWGYDGRLGFDYQIPNTMFVVGILGGYRGGETEFNVNSDIGGAGNLLSATMRQTWYAGGRVGITSGKALYYVGAAWTKGEMEISIPVAAGICSAALPPGMSLNCNQDVDGRMLLAGMEALITPQWSLGAEYTLTQYNTASIFSATDGTDSIGLNADTDVHAFMLRLSYRPLAK